MNNNDNILLETRDIIRRMLMLARNDRSLRMYAICSLWTINRMVAAQRAAEKLGKYMSDHIDRRIKNKQK